MKSFKKYVTSDDGEISLFKNIPIGLLGDFRKKYGTSFRIRFRGPRYDKMKLTTLKENAVAFSAYLKFKSKPYPEEESETLNDPVHFLYDESYRNNIF